MADKMFENNQVSIIGEIVSDFQFSHEVYGEGFYMMEVSVRRLSDCMDYIPVMVSERLINVEGDYIGKSVYIGGQFRSFNRHEEKKNRLVLSVFARELEVLDSDYDEDAANQIFLDGYICKEAIYRKTPLGREIADLLVAVNRSYGKSDYIPCICWGRNARFPPFECPPIHSFPVLMLLLLIFSSSKALSFMAFSFMPLSSLHIYAATCFKYFFALFCPGVSSR